MSLCVRVEFQVSTAAQMEECVGRIRSALTEFAFTTDVSFSRVASSSDWKQDFLSLLSSLSDQQFLLISLIAKSDQGVVEDDITRDFGLAKNALAGTISGLSRVARRFGIGLGEFILRRRIWTRQGAVYVYLLTPEAREALHQFNSAPGYEGPDSSQPATEGTGFKPTADDVRFVMREKAMRRQEIANALGVDPALLDALLTKENGFEKRARGWFIHR